jgi:hypothetical protein
MEHWAPDYWLPGQSVKGVVSRVRVGSSLVYSVRHSCVEVSSRGARPFYADQQR